VVGDAERSEHMHNLGKKIPLEHPEKLLGQRIVLRLFGLSCGL